MKKAILVTSVLTIGSAVSAFTWVPDAAITHRDWNNAPVQAQIKQMAILQRSIMASMKHFDIRTDELAEELDDVDALIKDAEKELLTASDDSEREKIKQRIERYKQMKNKAIKKLDRATGKDLELLASLSTMSEN